MKLGRAGKVETVMEQYWLCLRLKTSFKDQLKTLIFSKIKGSRTKIHKAKIKIWLTEHTINNCIRIIGLMVHNQVLPILRINLNQSVKNKKSQTTLKISFNNRIFWIIYKMWIKAALNNWWKHMTYHLIKWVHQINNNRLILKHKVTL